MSDSRRRSPAELEDEDLTLLRVRGICDELGVRSSMEAVVLAARHRVT